MTDTHLMRAARFVEPRRIEIAAVAPPEPAPDQVRIAVEGCGVCGSNLVVWQGLPWISYPLAPGEPGHEAWGRIDRVGSGVRGVRPGERCAFLTARGFAEYALADPATLVPLPYGTDIFPGEALGCALNIHRRAEVRAGRRTMEDRSSDARDSGMARPPTWSMPLCPFVADRDGLRLARTRGRYVATRRRRFVAEARAVFNRHSRR